MNTRTNTSVGVASPVFAIALPMMIGLPWTAGSQGGPDPCAKSTQETYRSCKDRAVSDFWLERAKCSNLPTVQERIACAHEALLALQDAREECKDQREAREEVCDRLGGGFYHPVIDPDDFVPLVDNPYFPLVPGTTFIYEKDKDGKIERVEVEVTDETKEILGVTCTAVRDVESLEGEVVEDTVDWFAQDVLGNVWYFGEISQEFEDGELVSIDGSWQAGVEGAQPGIIMKAAPVIGEMYRQEFLIEEAEDVGGVLSLTETVSVPFGRFTDCLQTEDFTPLEPGNLEHKYYAPGTGFVLEFDPANGQRLELIEILGP